MKSSNSNSSHGQARARYLCSSHYHSPHCCCSFLKIFQPPFVFSVQLSHISFLVLFQIIKRPWHCRDVLFRYFSINHISQPVDTLPLAGQLVFLTVVILENESNSERRTYEMIDKRKPNDKHLNTWAVTRWKQSEPEFCENKANESHISQQIGLKTYSGHLNKTYQPLWDHLYLLLWVVGCRSFIFEKHY